VTGKPDAVQPVTFDKALANDEPFTLDKAQPVEADEFPNPPRQGRKGVPATIPNVDFLLKHYGISAQYDVIKKKTVIKVPGLAGCPDNADNSSVAQILSLATLNGMATGQIPGFVEAIADRKQTNPVADWIMRKAWDGRDRFQELCDTLVTADDYPNKLKRILLRKWLLSAVAAALKPSGFRARGVLTLQGPQSIGKTAWISNLVSDPMLREKVIKLDHHLDAGNKDSVITAVTHWIVEIGELDSSFKKDVARLKGFLTTDSDKVRRPYAKADSEYPRRTVFCATVNDANFLVDTTGNSRWWTIDVTSINYDHGIDMQQLFAQVAVWYQEGDQWWLTPEEERMLEEQNKKHRSISSIHEQLLEVVDLEAQGQGSRKAMTSTQMLNRIDIKNPTNPQQKEACAFLREHFGKPKRIHGRNKWYVALRPERKFPGIDED